MALETDVASHYTTGALFERIKVALTALGVDPACAQPADLKPVDEFHTGGVEATDALLGQLDITAETRILDIGSGLGGTVRLVAGRYGCHATGVDLTPEFVETAEALTAMVGLADRATFHQGSALSLPVNDAAFDLAFLLHVGMNIADKPGLMREAARALKPGCTLAVFDVMRGGNTEALAFPLPWSTVPETSFVEPPAAYRAAAEGAGFAVVAERDRSGFALAFFEKVFAAIEAKGPPPLGIHLMMGETAGLKIQNYVANLKAGRIAPVEMILRKGHAADG